MNTMDRLHTLTYVRFAVLIKVQDEGSKTTVHQCPVCYGRGQVAGGFYLGNGPVSTSANLMDKCRSCDGKGYLVL
jgi:DnaJ-class molecular chaperone